MLKKGVVFTLLVAKRSNGTFLSLADHWTKKELCHIRKQEQFQCPVCQGNLHLKLGEKRSWHFAHERDFTCHIQTEPESPYHLQGKKQLFEWLSMDYKYVYLEPFIKKIRQRPDLLIIDRGKRYAVEYQCSNIPQQLFVKRTKAYLQIGIIPIWIIGAKRIKRLSETAFAISNFQFLFTRFNESLPQFYLTYYCSDTKQFLFLSSMMSFSSQYVLSSMSFYKRNEVSLNQLLHFTPNVPPLSVFSSWIIKKKSWRMTAHHPYKISNYFKQFFYQKGLTLGQLPAEAGIPVLSMIMIETPAILWQGWILVMFIHPRKHGEFIYFDDILSQFNKQIIKGIIKLRHLPLVEDRHYSFAIMEYLQELTKIEVLKKVGRKKFKKVRHCKVPRSLEEALHLDHEWMKKFVKAKM